MTYTISDFYLNVAVSIFILIYAYVQYYLENNSKAIFNFKNVLYFLLSFVSLFISVFTMIYFLKQGLFFIPGYYNGKEISKKFREDILKRRQYR